MRIDFGEPKPLDSLDGLRLHDPATYVAGCRHDVWLSLRRHRPVGRDHMPDGTPYWSFATYADCDKIVKDTATYSSEDGTILASVGVGDSAGGQTITLMDPPDHSAIRRPLMRTMRQSVVRRRADAVRAKVLRLIDPLLAGGEHDIARLMRLLPMVAAGDLLGIPEQHWETVAFNTTASIAPEDPEYAVGRDVGDTLRRVHHRLFAVFAETIETRRRDPGEDVVTALLGLEIGGRPIDDRRVMLNCYSVALGANSTTPHVACHTLLALAERPEIWRAVMADPALIPALVEEGARWTSPTHHLIRRVTADTELGGVRMAAGDWVCAWVASANRDEQVFDDPYAFDLRRAPNPHLGFGAGAHYCIGAPASRYALSVIFEELARRRVRFEVAGEVRHLYSNWINGITSLPMRFTPDA
ncbi:cytochrome P450 [Sphaerisporangium melleum]|uniref:Cytochrome P450 n=1 Tax=Sphaerisporangium melleum TaxID=321316 RepID=A0A917QZX8_9ACTN|nr:cytochrome P450 [Sphaerisporangium melleum]GGK78166.1 cytochrome P450 [Sphaerisporangium melleum]GII71940.1 cytochrome P450 [Sphaerisporangium melleum]